MQFPTRLDMLQNLFAQTPKYRVGQRPYGLIGKRRTRRKMQKESRRRNR